MKHFYYFFFKTTFNVQGWAVNHVTGIQELGKKNKIKAELQKKTNSWSGSARINSKCFDYLNAVLYQWPSLYNFFGAFICGDDRIEKRTFWFPLCCNALPPSFLLYCVTPKHLFWWWVTLRERLCATEGQHLAMLASEPKLAWSKLALRLAFTTVVLESPFDVDASMADSSSQLRGQKRLKLISHSCENNDVSKSIVASGWLNRNLFWVV